MGSQWGITEELLAQLVEQADAARQGTTVGFAKKGYKPKLHRIPRPHDDRSAQRRVATVEDMESIFGAPGLPPEAMNGA